MRVQYSYNVGHTVIATDILWLWNVRKVGLGTTATFELIVFHCERHRALHCVKLRPSWKGSCPAPCPCIPVNNICLLILAALLSPTSETQVFGSPFSISEQCSGDSGSCPSKMRRSSSRSTSVSVFAYNVLSVFVIIIVNLLSMLNFVDVGGH